MLSCYTKYIIYSSPYIPYRFHYSLISLFLLHSYQHIVYVLLLIMLTSGKVWKYFNKVELLHPHLYQIILWTIDLLIEEWWFFSCLSVVLLRLLVSMEQLLVTTLLIYIRFHRKLPLLPHVFTMLFAHLYCIPQHFILNAELNLQERRAFY